MFKRLTVVTISVLMIGGCGGSGGPAKLSSDQKATFTNTLDSTGRGAAAAKSASRPATAVNSFSAAATPANPDVDQLAAKLRAANCAINAPDATSFQKAGDLSAPQTFKISVTGDTCPITLSYVFGFNMDLAQDGSKMTIKLNTDFSYKITDATVAAAYDVSEFALKGDITITGSESDGSASGGMAGYIVSKKYNKVPINIAVTASNKSAEMTMTFAFADFSAQLKVVGDGSSNGLQYSLNGETISEAEFQGYLKKLGGQ